jgi:hypothetical protein
MGGLGIKLGWQKEYRLIASTDTHTATPMVEIDPNNHLDFNLNANLAEVLHAIDHHEARISLLQAELERYQKGQDDLQVFP